MTLLETTYTLRKNLTTFRFESNFSHIAKLYTKFRLPFEDRARAFFLLFDPMPDRVIAGLGI